MLQINESNQRVKKKQTAKNLQFRFTECLMALTLRPLNITTSVNPMNILRRSIKPRVKEEITDVVKYLDSILQDPRM